MWIIHSVYLSSGGLKLYIPPWNRKIVAEEKAERKSFCEESGEYLFRIMKQKKRRDGFTFMLRVFLTNPHRPWQGYFEACRIKCFFFASRSSVCCRMCVCRLRRNFLYFLFHHHLTLLLSLAFPFHTLDSCCWLAGCWCASQRSASNFSKHELLLLWIASESAHQRDMLGTVLFDIIT